METPNNQHQIAQVIEITRHKTAETSRKQPKSAGEMLPCLQRDAPSALRARNFSLERLRKDWGVTRTVALELVLAGLVIADDDRGANALRVRKSA